jgi:methionyl-tRNA formyltransferase
MRDCAKHSWLPPAECEESGARLDILEERESPATEGVFMKVHVATSRPVGEECKKLVSGLVSMEECDIFISVLYERIVSDEFIRSKKACFNFHPAVLPEYRGIGAYSWAIINEERESGVTLHVMDREIDHGPIIDVRRYPIEDTDTAEAVFAKAEALLIRMFRDWYDRLVAGDFVATEQDHSRARMYYRKDLEKARDLTRYVRAFTFTGRPNAYYEDRSGTTHELAF